MPTEQPDFAGPADGVQPGAGLRDVHRLGVLPHQPEQHRAIGGMATPGERERAVEVRLDARDGLQPAGVGQRAHEAQGDAHRPHRVRTRRADADLEQVENADRHGCAYASGENAAGERNTLSWWTR